MKDLIITEKAYLPRTFKALMAFTLVLLFFNNSEMVAQTFSQSDLNFNGNGGVNQGTSLMFGPDQRLYVVGLKGQVDIFTIEQQGDDNYVVTASEELLDVLNIPNHNDDGSSTGTSEREATGLTVAGTAANPVIYVTSSDPRVGGPSGDKNLDTNSGIITRFTWNGNSWDVVDIVRGLPRSEENHATNGLEFVTIGTTEYLIVSSGGHANAGGPSDNFAWTTEYALSAAILSVNLTMLEGMQIKNDGGRQYIYDIPTLDDPTRDNVFADGSPASEDPNDGNYSPIDINDPWGGNDGVNQAMIVEGGPVQIFSPGYRNSYDLVIAQDGKVFCTDNGANGGWGGLPTNEGIDGTVTNDYNITFNSNGDVIEIGSTGGNPTADGESVNNQDHLTMITDNIQNYTFGSFYGGHPTPVRANVNAGLFTNPEVNSYNPATSVFRTLTYDPNGSTSGSTSDASIALPANWPPIVTANPVEGDWRGPGINNPDGPNDVLVTTWGTNTNGIDEYTSTIFTGNESMVGDLIAGKNGGILRRVELNSNGSLENLTSTFVSGLGGNPLGITCNSDSDPFPGTIWVATFNGTIKVLEPNASFPCVAPFVGTDDNDLDGYTNQDELDNKAANLFSDSALTDEQIVCNAGVQPNDFDKAAGGTLVSDLNDLDDDNDGIPDSDDPFQLGNPTNEDSDAFDLPVLNELESDNPVLLGYLGLGFTGLMNNGDANLNWLNWIDLKEDGPNPNDLLGGAIGAMTMQMTDGTALGNTNTQEKGFQYGVNVNQNTGGFTIEGSLLNFTDALQLYGNQAPANGELGIFMGDGTQSNYIKLVINTSGIQVLQEINDATEGAVIDIPVTQGNRPSQNVKMRFDINPTNGSVTASYAFEGGAFQVAGTLNAQGSILTAIQNTNTPLAVGLIGSSNEEGVELEGTWDYLNVQLGQPSIEQQFSDLTALIGDSDSTFNLDDYFTDNDGDNNLTYTVQSNTGVPSIGASISDNTLTISYPNSEATGIISIRATDSGNLFTEQSFLVSVSDEPMPILRIRANGPTITSTDSPNPDWISAGALGAQSGSFNGINFSINTGNFSTQNISGRDASVPDYVPQSIFANERWDPAGTAPDMEWTFDLPDGNYLVRLYMGNGYGGTSEPGERVFDILIEGELVENDLDLSDAFGHQVGGMKEYQVNLTGGTLNILFEAEMENPTLNGIEILSLGDSFIPPITVNSIADQINTEGNLINIAVDANGGSNNETFSYSATGLPGGIQIEPTTGLVFGTINEGTSANSPYNVTITANKPSSPAQSIQFVWTVLEELADTWTNQTDDENYTARHECSFVQAGDKFYLIGGRENPTALDVYDYQSKTWSTIENSAPSEFNHYQAIEYNGLIWVIGAFKTNSFPNEAPADFIWTYNPATNAWIQGPEIPQGRKRGSAGLVMYNNKFYVVAGNTIGHNGGYISWFDEFDPATGIWTQLADAPRARDHFHAAVIGDKLYVAGGRLSGGTGGTFAPLIAEVDVYDFTLETWSTLPIGQNLPTPRAAASVGVLGNELYVIGGEIENDLDGNLINDAVKTTEAYNPATSSWSTKADLITERHGTQAIVSGNGIHVTAGSSSKGGGGTMKNMEFYGVDSPVGTSLVAGQLDVASSLVIPAGGSSNITLTHEGGNAGILISDIQITGAAATEFNIGSSPTYSSLQPNGSIEINVNHGGIAGGKTATMTITYDGNKTATVALVSGNPEEVLFRVNAGGALTPSNNAQPVDWSEDQADATNGNANGSAVTGTPSPFVNTADVDITFGATFVGTNNSGYPNALFNTERYSTLANPNSMKWDFPLDNGDYTVNLIFAETWTGAQNAGIRVFDVQIEGNTVLTDFDQTAAYGWNTVGVESFNVTISDGNLDIDFIKGAQNPNIKAIEILGVGDDPIEDLIPIDVTQQISNQNNVEDETPTVGVTATGGDGFLNFIATGLPAGLSINSTTGAIEGTIALGASTGGPNNDGDHFVTVTVDDADIVSTDAVTFNFSWIVTSSDPQTGTAPVVVDPGTLFGVDGGSVAVQIQATGDTNCGPLEYSAIGLPPSLDINSSTGEITGQLDEIQGSGIAGAFIEEDGLLVIEMESAANLPGSWQDINSYSTEFSPNVNSPLSATGDNFIIWQAGQNLGTPGVGVITYPIQINTPGTYRFQWRNQVGFGTATADHNDSWLKIEADAFYGEKSNGSSIVCPNGSGPDNDCTGNSPNGASSGGWFKIFLSDTLNWAWGTKTSDNDSHFIYARFDNPGTYNILVSARSSSHAIDRMVLAKVDDYSQQDARNLNLPESQRTVGGSPGASENSPYNVTVTATDSCDPQESGSASFVWNVTGPQTGTPSASVSVSPGTGIAASTFTGGSFQVTNTGDIDIVSVALNINTSFLPDVVWDPNGLAGDSTAKCLVVGSEGGTGYVVPGDNCVDPFSQFHNGVNANEGFDAVNLAFSDFNTGETFTFSSDNDPTSIKNDQTAGSAGAISGFELIGSSVLITFADGTVLSNSLFDEGTLGGSESILVQNLPSAPILSVLGVSDPAVVSDPNQTVQIQGSPNTNITLLQVDARLYIDSGSTGGPYDIDPFEANEAMTKALYSLTLDGSGNGSIPITLLQTGTTNAGPDGGINHFIAVEENNNGQAGATSNVVVLEYDPSAAFGELDINYTLQGRTDHSINLTVNVFSLTDGDNPLFNFELSGDSDGVAVIDQLEQGEYQIAVKSSNHLQRVLGNVLISSGTNSINIGELLAGDVDNNNIVNIFDFGLLSSSFGLSSSDPGFDERADCDGNGIVNIFDFGLLSSNFGATGETTNTP